MPTTEVTILANDYKAAIDYLKDLARYAPRITEIASKYNTNKQHYTDLQRIITDLEMILSTDIGSIYTIRRT
jgi:hypothetical protein